MTEKKRVVAAFDFDGTLSYCDSLVPFLFFSFGPLKTAVGLICELPTLIAYLAGHRTRQETKEHLLTRFVKGLPQDSLKEMGQRFAVKRISRLLKPKMVERLRWHLAQGHRCLLISASLDIYLQPWATSVGIRDVISSRLAFDEAGMATGRLDGLNCRGPEKARRLLELVGAREGFILYAYGDSDGDKELLALADHPVKV
jgi:phosphatidylglycerophosphatase C